jgi:hypothetical protein
MASTCSRATARRRAGSTPWWDISSSFQPTPIPNTKRPPDSTSRLATALAVTMGSRCATRQIPVPSWMRSVTAAAAVRARNGSCVRLYSSGSSPPAGYGVRRLTGMWVCSGK